MNGTGEAEAAQETNQTEETILSPRGSIRSESPRAEKA
jgi:hypothetical protein